MSSSPCHFERKPNFWDWKKSWKTTSWAGTVMINLCEHTTVSLHPTFKLKMKNVHAMATWTFQTHILKVYNHTSCLECVDFKTQLSLHKALQDHILFHVFFLLSERTGYKIGEGGGPKYKSSFEHDGLQEHQLSNIIHKGMGLIFMVLGLIPLSLGLALCWLCGSQDSLKPFPRWITVPLEVTPQAKCARLTIMVFVESVFICFKILPLVSCL